MARQEPMVAVEAVEVEVEVVSRMARIKLAVAVEVEVLERLEGLAAPEALEVEVLLPCFFGITEPGAALPIAC